MNILRLYRAFRKNREYLRALNEDFRLSRNFFNHMRALGCNVHPTARAVGLPNLMDRVRVTGPMTIQRDVTVWLDPDAEGTLTFGRGSFVGPSTYIGVGSSLTIGDNVLIGAFGYIISAEHRHGESDVPISDQGYDRRGVSVGEGAWLGAHVFVRDGVAIGSNSIVGAGGVVLSSVPDGEVWAGVPAKRVRIRSTAGRGWTKQQDDQLSL